MKTICKYIKGNNPHYTYERHSDANASLLVKNDGWGYCPKYLWKEKVQEGKRNGG